MFGPEDNEAHYLGQKDGCFYFVKRVKVNTISAGESSSVDAIRFFKIDYVDDDTLRYRVEEDIDWKEEWKEAVKYDNTDASYDDYYEDCMNNWYEYAERVTDVCYDDDILDLMKEILKTDDITEKNLDKIDYATFNRQELTEYASEYLKVEYPFRDSDRWIEYNEKTANGILDFCGLLSYTYVEI